MTLEMRTECERCSASLAEDADAFICSYECTFCPKCSDELARSCPNCGGDLVARPKRNRDEAVADPTFSRGWATPLDEEWLAKIRAYLETRADVARAYAVTTTYREQPAHPQEELMIELVEPREVRAPIDLFREFAVPGRPVPDRSGGGPTARISFTFTPRRLVETVRANGELVWEREL